MIPDLDTAAACSNVTLDGFRAMACSARMQMYSAKDPPLPPKTSSPGLKRVTLLPTASITPAKSDPRRVFLGLVSPLPMRARNNPVTVYHCSGFTEEA